MRIKTQEMILKKISHNSSTPTLSLLIICKNIYLNIGMIHLINNIQPVAFHKTGKLCDVKTLNSPDELDLDSLSKEYEHCLVIERRDYPALKEKLKSTQTPPRFKSIFFLSSGGRSFTNQINFLPSKPSLEDIKRLLFKIMTTDYGADMGSIERHTCSLCEDEKHLLRLIIAEKSVAEIASTLKLTPQSIYASRTRLLAKLGMGSLAELVMSASILDL